MDKPTFDDIDIAERELNSVKEAYLRRFGWDLTCSTPGSFWLWKRDFKDVDARHMEALNKRHAEAIRHGVKTSASQPVLYGLVTAPTDLAVKMTAACLDMGEEVSFHITHGGDPRD